MNLYNQFFYLAQYTYNESETTLVSPSPYGFNLYLIADTGVDVKEFNLPFEKETQEKKIALYINFKVLFCREEVTQESSSTLASLLYKDDFNHFISSFENYSQYSRDVVLKGRKQSSDLYCTMEDIVKEIKSNTSNPLNLSKFSLNDYQKNKNRILRGICHLPFELEDKIEKISFSKEDRYYKSSLQNSTPADKVFRKLPFFISNPQGVLSNIKLRDKLELSLTKTNTTKVHKI